jgi:glyoxylase-like metal-dependent hydrolase (beta-lactamase superfamily II)
MKIFEIDEPIDRELLVARPGELPRRDRAWSYDRRPSLSRSGLAAPAVLQRVNLRSPSRSLRLHVLDLGTLRLDRNFVVANSTVATTTNPNPKGQTIDIPVPGYFIEHPDGNVLFDTGCHPDWSGPNGRWPAASQELFPLVSGEECTLPARLDALGLGPEQIRHVVLSHLHCDHAGCVEFFRKSRIIVHEDEFAGAFKHYAAGDQIPVYIRRDLDAMVQAELRWHQVGRWEPDQTIVDGVKLLNFGTGHAYGMLGLQVGLQSQPGVILVSDACYTADNYGPPYKPAGISYDSVGAARTVQRIRLLARETGYGVWFGHDAAQFASLRRSTQGYYE